LYRRNILRLYGDNYANITFSAEKNPFECKKIFSYANRLRSGILTLHRESNVTAIEGSDIGELKEENDGNWKFEQMS
jgi:hypothetical protein